VLGQLPGKEQTHCRLDLPRRDGRALVVMRQTRRLGRDALEDVIHERIHDAHRFGRNTRIGVNLLQNLVDVNGVALLSASTTLAGTLSSRLRNGFLRTLLRRHLLGRIRRHDEYRMKRQPKGESAQK